MIYIYNYIYIYIICICPCRRSFLPWPLPALQCPSLSGRLTLPWTRARVEKGEGGLKVDILGRNARSTAFSVIIGFDWFCVWDSILLNLLNFFWFLVGLSCDGIWAYLTTLLQAFVGPARFLWKRPYATKAVNAVQWRLPRVRKGWKDS